MELQPYQQRVVDEKNELDTKRALLAIFLSGPVFSSMDPVDQALRLTQAVAMGQYSSTLGKIIARFQPT